MKLRRSKNASLNEEREGEEGEGEGCPNVSFILSKIAIFDRIKKATPFPSKAMINSAKAQKRDILASLKSGGRVVQIPFIFVQDCGLKKGS